MKVLGIMIAIVCFLLLVTGHEAGHFGVAKFLGMKVNEFSVGMGPLILSKKKKETQYSLRAIPLGGYCLLEGEDDDSEDPRSFSKQPAWAKILVLLAGPFVNIVIGILIFTLLYCYRGTAVPTLADVYESTPAYEAGLRAGDKIIEVDGKKYNDFASIRNAIGYSTGDTITLTIVRDGETMHAYSGYMLNDQNLRVIGILAGSSHKFSDCLNSGIKETAVVAIDVAHFFRNLFKGNVQMNDVSSVVGIVKIAGDAAEVGGLINVIYIIALVSANLGYMNLLPIPALDGGRVLFTLLRCIFKGEGVDKFETALNAVGMVLLIGLMIVIMFKDIIGLF